MLPPSAVMFLLPLDFMRIVWIVTPFDVVAAAYLLPRLISGQVLIRPFAIAVFLFVTLSVIVAVSGIANAVENNENFILIGGLALSILKGLAIVDAMSKKKLWGSSSACWGFLALNVIQTVLFVTGIGFTGSDRFSGLFDQSNGAAVFQAFAFAFALYNFHYRKNIVPLLVIVSSILFIFVSGSRGSLVSVVLIFFMYIAFISIASVKRFSVVAILGLTASVALLAVDTEVLAKFLATMTASESGGVARIGGFLRP
ncbi:hypothetical protein [Sphingopyxis macrogoltabida]|uniref:Uncharacterized protein n=1 Tax=Sphingopyxis macrogoltabida TaxID=33050 RepID=A0AAC9AY28_SPHMC|nr:hypothetical protein [Sphingopyxis macrogoltabida]AMU91892.1 hypothetical protein ATM17_23045 [Sphingopyxis macrogoltabida]